MERLITVTGTGSATSKPDRIEISITIVSLAKVYEKAYNMALDKLENLNTAIKNAGFNLENLKTLNFDTNTEYKYIKDKDGDRKNVFIGCKYTHRLNLDFPFDTKLLGAAFEALTNSGANPEFTVHFYAQDREKIERAMLEDAAKSAKRKAITLCEAIGAKLGQLVKINYNWDEINIYSQTTFKNSLVCEECAARSFDISAEDIEVSDNATFQWEIVTD